MTMRSKSGRFDRRFDHVSIFWAGFGFGMAVVIAWNLMFGGLNPNEEASLIYANCLGSPVNAIASPQGWIGKAQRCYEEAISEVWPDGVGG